MKLVSTLVSFAGAALLLSGSTVIGQDAKPAAPAANASPAASSAASPAPAAAGEPGRIGGPEANIRRLLEPRLRPGTKIDGITRTPYFGLYEIRSGNEIIAYTDERVSYLIIGSILDGRTLDNLTEERLNKLSAIKFDELPLANAIKMVNGNGKRQLAYFSDPNCGYCKQFERTLQQVKDATIHIFPYPILSEDSAVKSRAIWCSSDRLKTWNDWMLRNQAPTGNGDCTTPIEANQELGRRLKVQATPTIYLANGQKIPGAIPLAQLEKHLAESSK